MSGLGATLGVVLTPRFDDDSCLGKAVGDHAVEQFVAGLRVGVLAIAVLPRAIRGSMKAMPTLKAAIHCGTASAIDSSP
jgi:hypothetical protein